MAKKEFVSAIVAVVLLASQGANAESITVTRDGCAELSRLVYAEVSAAALYGPGRSGPWVIDQGQGDISSCDSTAKTVSKAFTLAMNSAGHNVNWQSSSARDDTRNGDYCWSGILSQCYPNRERSFDQQFSLAASTVQTTWAAVSGAVMRHMHNPYSSDVIHFRDNDLKLRLGLTLRMSHQDRLLETR